MITADFWKVRGLWYTTSLW